MSEEVKIRALGESFDNVTALKDEISKFETKEEKLQLIAHHINDIKTHLEIFKAHELDESEFIFEQFKCELKLLKNLKKEIKLSVESAAPRDEININKSITLSLVLLRELGIWNFLREKVITENKGSDRDLEKLIAYIIKHKNPDSVGRYFPAMNNPESNSKYSPYTGPAIKMMKQILKECNIELKGKYPNKKDNL